MAGADLSAQFEKISDNVKTANDKIKAAGTKTKDQLEADLASARAKASATADQLSEKAEGAHEKLHHSRKKSAASGRRMSPR